MAFSSLDKGVTNAESNVQVLLESSTKERTPQLSFKKVMVIVVEKFNSRAFG